MIFSRFVLLTFLLLILLAAPGSLVAQSPSPTDGAPAGLLQRATEVERSQGVEAAIALLQAESEGDTQARGYLGALYLKAKQPEDAFRVLEPLASSGGGGADGTVLYNAALAAFGLERYEEGQGFLERAIETPPDTRAVRMLAFIRFQQRKTEEALGLFDRWLATEQGDAEARTAAVFCALQLARYEDAGRLIDGLPQQDPRAIYLRGQLLLRQSDFEGAAQWLSPHVEGLLANDVASTPFAGQAGLGADVLADFARARFAAGVDAAETVPYLERATQLQASHQAAWQMLGQALVAAERFDEAQAALERAQSLTQQREQPPAGGGR